MQEPRGPSLTDLFDSGGATALAVGDREMAESLDDLDRLSREPVRGWKPEKYGIALGLDLDTIARVLQVVEQFNSQRKRLSSTKARREVRKVLSKAGLEAAVDYNRSYGTALEAFVECRVSQAYYHVAWGIGWGFYAWLYPYDSLVVQATNGGERAYRILFYHMRKKIGAKVNSGEWWVKRWNKEDLIDELMDCFFTAMSRVIATADENNEDPPAREFRRPFWTLVRCRLADLIRRAKAEDRALEMRGQDPRPRIPSKARPTMPAAVEEEAGEEAGQIRRAIDAVRRRATRRQRELMDAVVSAMTLSEEPESIFSGMGRRGFCRINPRDVAGQVTITPKAASKALGRVRGLLADELRRYGLAYRVPVRWRRQEKKRKRS